MNNAGRGVNVAVYDTATGKVIRATRFDTYESADGIVFTFFFPVVR